MGFLGSLAGEGLGKVAGGYFGGQQGADIGGQIGKFAGSYLPFRAGGYVDCGCGKKMRRRRMRKGGVAMDMEEYQVGGYVAPAVHRPITGYMGIPRNYGDSNPMLFVSTV